MSDRTPNLVNCVVLKSNEYGNEYQATNTSYKLTTRFEWRESVEPFTTILDLPDTKILEGGDWPVRQSCCMVPFEEPAALITWCHAISLFIFWYYSVQNLISMKHNISWYICNNIYTHITIIFFSTSHNVNGDTAYCISYVWLHFCPQPIVKIRCCWFNLFLAEYNLFPYAAMSA